MILSIFCVKIKSMPKTKKSPILRIIKVTGAQSTEIRIV